MKKFLKTVKQISILILTLSLIGCEDDKAVLPNVIADFTFTLNINTGTVTFINISENADTYVWDFGDETSSTEINPVKTYTNGTYTVVLKAKNNSGASDTFQSEITILIPEVATLPITFDDANTRYDVSTFGGASFEIVDNPDPSGSNSSVSKVGAVTNVGAAFEGFYLDLGAPIDLSTLKTIKVNFWSDMPIDVLLKLEEGAAPAEVTTSHGGTGWEEIYFTFDSDGSYSRFTMFIDGPGTSSGTFYIDDISQIATSDIPCNETDLVLPVDFDCNGIAYADKIVGNVSFEVVDNPELSGINSDVSKVGKIVNVGENWENAFFNFDAPVDFSTDKGIRFKLFSEQALPVKLKFEDGTEGPIEVDVNHGGTGWEELTFTFVSTASYNDMVLFIDGPGTAAGTFYIDDIEQVAGDVADPCEAETMQSLAGADLNLTFMTDPSSSIIEDGGDFEWIDNPDFDNDVNKSCKVGKITKLGANPWDNNQIDLDAKLDFNANAGLKIKVWSGRANTEIRIKLEEIGNPGNNVEQFLTTSVTSAWEELTFPFSSGDSDKFNKIVIFFDLNANNTDTYYFDDLALYGSGGGGGGGTFDDGLLTNGDFEDGATAWSGNAVNVQTDGGNSFNFADVMAAGNPFDVNLSQVVEIIQGKNYTLSFDASSGVNRTIIAGIGLNQDPWTSDTETVNLTTSTQNFSFDFVSSFGNANSRVLFDMGAEIGTVVIDNVSLTCSDCDGGSGGGGGGGTGDNLAANGDFETGDDTGWILFQNGGTAIIDNTISNGGSWSGKIETGGPSNPAFKQERIGAGTVMAGDVVQIQFDHIGAIGGEGGVFNVLLFGEGAGGAVPFTHVFNPAPVLSGTWSTFTGTFAIPGGTDVSEGISFLIETVCGGAAGCSVSANIDNVSVTLNP